MRLPDAAIAELAPLYHEHTELSWQVLRGHGTVAHADRLAELRRRMGHIEARLGLVPRIVSDERRAQAEEDRADEIAEVARKR